MEDKIRSAINDPDGLRQGHVHLRITGAFAGMAGQGTMVNAEMLRGKLIAHLVCVLVSEQIGDVWRVTYHLAFWRPTEEFMASVRAGRIKKTPEIIIFTPVSANRPISIGETFRGKNIR